ncbi:hypothetical protein [Anaerotignum sp.]|uniref:hypothetical protein n=1 Tax=Anaerotignum sp. TaxID=2039241 RepID=UPI00289BDE03|nr:hypothetical protein [Anaerotignum sp.]
MEKAKIILKMPYGETKEYQIHKNKPAFLFFKSIDEYRFNTVIECLEKKINGEWQEWDFWDEISYHQTLSRNPLWSEQRKALYNKILFIKDERKIQLIASLADILMTTQEINSYKEFAKNLVN